MKKDDLELQNGSGLFHGSEPIDGINQRAAGQDDSDSKDGGPLGGDKGDDDSGDTDESDSDQGDGGEDSADADGKD